MEGLNYHHLLYFRVVAREGSIARAAEHLKVSQPTISEQIRTLEQQVGMPLFTRHGRRLELTDAGRTALRFAEDIHTLGDEMLAALGDQPRRRQQKLTLGIVDGITTELAARVVAAFANDGLRVIVTRGNAEALLEEASTGAVDIVVSDSANVPGKAFKVQKLLSTPVIIAAPASIARTHKARFPQSLAGIPFVMPAANTRLARSLEEWFAAKKIRPLVLAECSDAAMLECLARDSQALMPVAGELPRGFSLVGTLARLKIDLYLVAKASAAARVKAAQQSLRRSLRQ